MLSPCESEGQAGASAPGAGRSPGAERGRRGRGAGRRPGGHRPDVLGPAELVEPQGHEVLAAQAVDAAWLAHDLHAPSARSSPPTLPPEMVVDQGRTPPWVGLGAARSGAGAGRGSLRNRVVLLMRPSPAGGSLDKEGTDGTNQAASRSNP